MSKFIKEIGSWVVFMGAAAIIATAATFSGLALVTFLESL